ncbi:MAG: NYN domain-containing protein [Candidatus Hydrothermae bacterium]|nr:NYN domain-containing protein [Candidatus Hydrothermae bacterium]
MKNSKSYLSNSVRVGIFVDVQNMFYSAKEYFGGKVDFEKLLAQAVRDRTLVVAFAYLITSEEVDQSGFISVLEHLGFNVKAKPLKRRPDGSARGDWDMGIAIDSILFAPKLDVVVLVSGDGDFTELVRVLQAQGTTVEVMSFPQNTSDELKKVADRFVPLTEDIIIKKNHVMSEEQVV